MDTEPLYRIKADLFKALAHPVRIQILEVLAAAEDAPTPVSRLAEVTSAEASQLSQHLGVLKRSGVVSSRRIGNSVEYQLGEPAVAELLVVARGFLLGRLAGHQADAESQLKAARRLPALPGASARAVLDATGAAAQDSA